MADAKFRKHVCCKAGRALTCEVLGNKRKGHLKHLSMHHAPKVSRTLDDMDGSREELLTLEGIHNSIV